MTAAERPLTYSGLPTGAPDAQPADETPWKRHLTLREIEVAGAALMTPGSRAYYEGAAADEVTLRDNQAAFERWRIVPRMMVPNAGRDASVEILGRRWPMPVAIAPMALQRLGHPDGEVAVARAAAARGLTYLLSTCSSASFEEIEATGVDRWFQLYLLSDRGRSLELIQQAEATGHEALVLTMDTPMTGLRERDQRFGFKVPPDVLYCLIRRSSNQRGVNQLDDDIQSSYSWDDVEWVLANTKLPVLVKGILHPDDARGCIDRGCAGVVVSNHGGRQQDVAIPAIDAVPWVADAVGERGIVLMDSGVRRGTDVLTALALGARAVLLGRPVLFALPLGGEPAVGHALDLLANEIDRGLALSGIPNARDWRREHLVRAGTLPG
ncbi:MAG: alpha-hydroxy acid oxidase [Chloroflexota bacterium]